MAQTGPSDPPGTPATSDLSPSQGQTTTLPIADGATISTEITTGPRPSIPQYQQTTDTQVESDNEVQFIFSAPRRRKKKRRKIESPHVSREDFQGFKDTTDPQKTPTPSEPPRRGTTGMVQRLESCNIWDIEGKPVPSTSRSGSLPLVPPTTNPNANPNLQRCPTTPNASRPSPQFLPFAPFMSIPWWTSPGTELQDVPMMQDELFSVRPEQKASQKRKREEEVEQSMPHPIQHSLDEQMPSEGNSFSEMEGMDTDPIDISNTSSAKTNSTNSLSPSSRMQNFSWTLQSSASQNQGRSPIPTTPYPNLTKSSDPHVRVSQEAPSQISRSVQINQNSRPQQQTITVPARLVPERSVSPRTQTVEVPGQPFANQIQPRQMMMLQRSMTTSGQSVPSTQSQASTHLTNRNNQFQIPRSVPPQPLLTQGFQRSEHPNRPQNQQQTYSSDIQRKPSLYTVPPWPSPPSPNGSTQQSLSSTSRSPALNASGMKSDLGINNSWDLTANNLSCSQRRNMVHGGTAAGRPNNFLPQRDMPITPPRTPPVQFQARLPAQSSSPPPTQPQSNPNKRKHSPNLIVDIAETCQANFPFAAVADRHQQPIQKVFDTFSAIIQLPLLRSAADNRRHGSLGKRRMKEFRDARKAMEKEMKEKDNGGGGEGRSGRGRKKKTEQPLLRTAVLNNASRKE